MLERDQTYGMREEKLRSLLDEIEDLTTRKELSQVCQTLVQNFDQYQQEQLDVMRYRIEEELYQPKGDYAVDMFCCKSEDVDKWEEWFAPILSTGMHAVTWGDGPIERIFIKAEDARIKQELREHAIYPAVVHTNYDTYPVKVTLRQVNEGIELAWQMNRLMAVEGVKLPPVNDCYFRKFYDVCFDMVNDRMRPDEVVMDVDVEWGAFGEYIEHDVTLLWNVWHVEAKEQAFPIPIAQKNVVKYAHEIVPRYMDCAYLVEVPDAAGYQVSRDREKITVLTADKKYTNWKLYEIVPRSAWMGNIPETEIVTNRVKDSIFNDIAENRRIYTEAEIYRNLMSYEMIDFFEKVELLREGEVLFFPREAGHYLNRDMMEYIMNDLSEMFRGYTLRGRLVEDK